MHGLCDLYTVLSTLLIVVTQSRLDSVSLCGCVCPFHRTYPTATTFFLAAYCALPCRTKPAHSGRHSFFVGITCRERHSYGDSPPLLIFASRTRFSRDCWSRRLTVLLFITQWDARAMAVNSLGSHAVFCPCISRHYALQPFHIFCDSMPFSVFIFFATLCLSDFISFATLCPLDFLFFCDTMLFRFHFFATLSPSDFIFFATLRPSAFLLFCDTMPFRFHLFVRHYALQRFVSFFQRREYDLLQKSDTVSGDWKRAMLRRIFAQNSKRLSLLMSTPCQPSLGNNKVQERRLH